MIRLSEVTKEFRHKNGVVSALDGVSLTVRKGQMISVMGPSGSGKTTMLMVIGGLLEPEAGSVRVLDTDYAGMGEKERTEFRLRNIGFAYQLFHLVPYMTVLENVELPLALLREERSRARERSVEVIEAVGLADKRDDRPGSLSVGERQRVAIARALAPRPSIVLADEPTGNLDSEASGEVMYALREINRRGSTVVIATHNSNVAGYARVRYRLRKGRLARSK